MNLVPIPKSPPVSGPEPSSLEIGRKALLVGGLGAASIGGGKLLAELRE